MFPAARNFDTDDFGWAQFLVVIIVAVLYGLSSLFKSRQAGREQEEEVSRRTGPRRLRPAAPARLQRRPLPKRVIARAAGPAQGVFAGRPAAEPVISKLKMPAGVTGQLETPVLGLKEPTLGKPREAVPELEEGISLELDDPERLRQAVVYREIFDLPLGLRMDQP
jgi:hypothetical protein